MPTLILEKDIPEDMFLTPNGEEFFDDCWDIRERFMDMQYPIPKEVFGTKMAKITLSAEHILEDFMFECAPEGVYNNLDVDGLQDVLDEWVKRQQVEWYEIDPETIIILDPKTTLEFVTEYNEFADQHNEQ